MEEQPSEARAKRESDVEQSEASASLWQDSWRRLSKNRLATAGLVLVTALTLACLFGPMTRSLPVSLRPAGLSHSYDEQDLKLREAAPSRLHWLGTDALGRDVFTRLLYGGRVSLTVALIATFVSLTIGVLWGAIAGYFGGHLDVVMMRFVDILYTLPLAIFVILLMVFVGEAFSFSFLRSGRSSG